MAVRFFYVIYIGEPILQIALDAIRLIANPQEKGLAHITVRGPYTERQVLDPFTLQVEGQHIHAVGVGDFFADGQNTVFIECESDALPVRWHKSHYAYRPHITLYDGPSNAFARRLKEIVSREGFNIRFRATGLAKLISEKGTDYGSLKRSLTTVGLSWLIGERLTMGSLDRLSEERRLQLIDRLWTSVLDAFATRSSITTESTIELFPRYTCMVAPLSAPQPECRDMFSLVSKAYLSMHRGYSIDRVIADPDANARFVQACWKLGAQASQADLNRALLNARKSKRIGPVPGVRSHAVVRQDLEQYLFASEIALRMVQDEEWIEQQRYVSLDRILCEPQLSYRFDQFAREIAPGFEPSAYRWAAITIRKSQNRRARADEVKSFVFQRLGFLHALHPTAFDTMPGLYWVRHARSHVYIGHTDDIRSELTRISSFRLHELPLLHRAARKSKVFDPDKMCVYFAPCFDMSPTRRDSLKAALIHLHHPGMNVRQAHDRAI